MRSALIGAFIMVLACAAVDYSVFHHPPLLKAKHGPLPKNKNNNNNNKSQTWTFTYNSLYKTLFYGHCNRGAVTEAELLFIEMESKDVALHWFDRMRNLGCIPSIFTYNTLIKCFCQEGRFEYAESLIDLMEGEGIVPDQATYLVIMNECCKRGDPELGFQTSWRWGITLSGCTYRKLLL
ncbi:hypothetical protein FEM48_Zijuj02G0048200 [Ziziphus jujuba var. spinosa]|uniref:Pentatricopeptide repeat-containing protein n=1 Tax=Ziziphus jujuba var. spinosa TaxID=714518 RepID=A0A978VTQ7_ZIZJJ|nr:hypothetical protein FEM48_Zijuj02G0048200 [Ziziphus jujuba var. spinosa]